MGGDGGQSVGTRRHWFGGTCHRSISVHNCSGNAGGGIKSGGGANPGAQGGRRTQTGRKKRSYAHWRFGRFGGTYGVRPSSVAAALDIEERTQTYSRTPGNGTRREPLGSLEFPLRGRLQSASKSQEQGETESPGSQCAICLHQPSSQKTPVHRPAGDFRRYEKEGTHWGFQKSGPGMASTRRASKSSGARLHYPPQGQSDSLRSLRFDAQRRVGERRDRPRYSTVCSQCHSTMVAYHGTSAISSRHFPADHGGLGRQQRIAKSALEMGVATICEPVGAIHYGLSFPSGNQQVEQDRAPVVFPYQHELERQTAHQPGGHHQPHCIHSHGGGPENSMRAGQRTIPQGRKDYRCGIGRPQHPAASVPRRLELYGTSKMSQLFPNTPLDSLCICRRGQNGFTF